MQILFMVGTHHKAFTRLIEWADRYQQEAGAENVSDTGTEITTSSGNTDAEIKTDAGLKTDAVIKADAELKADVENTSKNKNTDPNPKQTQTTKILVQYGTSPQPHYAQGQENYTHAEMEQLAKKLDAIVLPAGPSLMMEWVRRGYKPIIVPRDPGLDEHIDEHQLKFASGMQTTGLITLCHSYTELCTALQTIRKHPEQGKVGQELLDKFDREKSITRFSQLMQELLN